MAQKEARFSHHAISLRKRPSNSHWLAWHGMLSSVWWLGITPRAPARRARRHGLRYTSRSVCSVICAGAPLSPPAAAAYPQQCFQNAATLSDGT